MAEFCEVIVTWLAAVPFGPISKPPPVATLPAGQLAVWSLKFVSLVSVAALATNSVVPSFDSASDFASLAVVWAASAAPLAELAVAWAVLAEVCAAFASLEAVLAAELALLAVPWAALAVF